MLRSTNPYNRILSDSIIFADVLSEKAPLQKADFAGETFASRGGEVHTLSSAPGQVRTVFAISHGQVDGYGLMTQLKSEFDNLDFGQIAIRERRDGDFAGFRYVQLIEPRRHSAKRERTFTQEFTGAVLGQFPQLANEHVGMVANLEGPSEGNVWGNGVVITRLRSEKLQQMVALPRAEWKQTMDDIAKRTLNLLQRRPASAENFDSLVISSLGEVSALGISVAHALFSATPVYSQSINLFLSCDSRVQSLIVCGKENHWLMSQISTLEQVWRQLC